MLSKLSDYFSSCLSPVRVRNRYTHEYLVTGCRQCEACAKAKSNRYVSMINNMSKNSAQTFFITLTFSPDYLPVAHLSIDENHCVSGNIVHHRLVQRGGVMVDNVEHTSFSDSQPFDFSLSDYHFFNLGMPVFNSSSFLGKGVFGILDYSYLQRFFKRLRKLLSYAIPSLNFKYFAVGEYGSRTFRPHFHIILFLSDTVHTSELKNFISICWKYGLNDVQRVQSSAASYVASYCASSSSLPKFLQTKSLRPFCHHSAFSAYTFRREDTKTRLEELYRDDSPYTLQATPNGYDLFPIQNTLRLYAYPKPPRFNSLSNSETVSILCKYEDACIAQRCLNPRFPVKIVLDVFLSDFECKSFGSDNSVVETAYLTLSELHDAYKNSLDSSKKCNFVLLNKHDYGQIYSSYRAFCLARLLDCSSYDIALHVIRFYRGTASHPLNFELMLLNYQYSSLELCDTVQDVKYLYSFFNENSPTSALRSAGFDVNTFASQNDFASLGLSDARERFLGVVSNTHLSVIKHKDRNSYYLYSLHHG